MSKGSGGTRGSGPANNTRAGGNATGSRVAGLSSVKAYEASIKGNDIEHIGIFDSQGNLLAKNTGNGHSVVIPWYENRGLRDDIISTHNHPSKNGFGGSFSGDDFASAVWYNEKEMRAVDGKYTFVITRGPNGWRNVKDGTIKRQFNKILDQEYDTLARYRKNHGIRGLNDVYFEAATDAAAKRMATYLGGTYKRYKNE